MVKSSPYVSKVPPKFLFQKEMSLESIECISMHHLDSNGPFIDIHAQVERLKK
jgi:hypothetical protein